MQAKVAPDTKGSVMNLGKDSNNVCLHVNPCFIVHGDTNTTVCNSKDRGGVWGTEQQESAFPFQPRSITGVHLLLPGRLDHQAARWIHIQVPQCLNLEAINYLVVEGDFKIKCVAFE